MNKPAWKVRKQTKDSLAAADEARMRIDERIALRQARVKARLGKKTPRDERGNPHADEQISKVIQRALTAGVGVRFASRKGPGVLVVGEGRSPLPTGADYHIKKEEDHEDLTIYVPLWKHTGDKLKALSWMMVMRDHGPNAVSLNLNIGADVMAMAGAAKRKRGIGFARFLRERMVKHLAKALRPFGLEAPEFFIWIEADRASRAHIHGAIALPQHSDSRKLLRAVRRALKAAGGDWNKAEHENQLRLRKLYNSAGWVGYVGKWKNLTRLQLQDENTVAASGGLRSRAAAWYTEVRRTGDYINKSSGRSASPP